MRQRLTWPICLGCQAQGHDQAYACINKTSSEGMRQPEPLKAAKNCQCSQTDTAYATLSRLDEHAQLATAPPGDAQLVVQEQRLERGRAPVAAGPQVGRQLRERDLWQPAQEIADAACTSSQRFRTAKLTASRLQTASPASWGPATRSLRLEELLCCRMSAKQQQHQADHKQCEQASKARRAA